MSAAVPPERRAPAASAQLPLPQPAPAATLPAAAHQPAHAGVAERGPAAAAAPAAAARPAPGPRLLAVAAPGAAAFPQPAAPAAAPQSRAGLYEKKNNLDKRPFFSKHRWTPDINSTKFEASTLSQFLRDFEMGIQFCSPQLQWAIHGTRHRPLNPTCVYFTVHYFWPFSKPCHMLLLFFFHNML